MTTHEGGNAPASLDEALRDLGVIVVEQARLEQLVRWMDRQLRRWSWLYRKLDKRTDSGRTTP